MNKRKARDEAWNNGRSFSELKELIDSARNDLGPSNLNKSLTKEQVLDIFDKAIADRDLNERPKGHRYDAFKRREIMSQDGLLIQNILRECV